MDYFTGATSSTTTIDNFQTDYGQPNTNSMKVTGKWWVQDQPAGGYLKDISKLARDVVEHSVKSLRHDTLQRRKWRTVKETELTQTRTLSNNGANGDRQTIYRWVNREYRLEVKSCADRLVFEFFINAPGRNLLSTISRLYNIDLSPPISPAQLGVKSYKDLSPEAKGSSAT